jgi:mercuric ion transport protein
VKTTSKSGIGLGVLAGIAWVACCALPVLITAGTLSGAGAAFLAGKMPIIAIILTIAAVMAFAVVARRKTRTTGCGDSCGTGSGVGC